MIVNCAYLRVRLFNMEMENSIDKEQPFLDYPILLDDTLRKISGTNNRKTAIRKIVDHEVSNSISILCKVLFENDTDKKYIN